jgi:hypothetical protein
LKLLVRKAPTRLVTSIDDRDVRLNVSLQQSSQELSAAVRFIGSEALGTDAGLFFDV